MDSRWQNLPNTNTEFVPKSYSDKTSWEAKREHLRDQILFAAGLLPMPDRAPLNAQISNRLERDGYTIEKVSFQTLPNFFVGGTLFRSIDPKPDSHPGVLAPHGHSDLGRLNESDAASYQARGLTLARIGCTAFMWDMVDYNDSARHLSGEYQDVTYGKVHRAAWGEASDERILWNFNLLGLQLWNSIRALDFLESLPEVDSERLVCTGESGGGTQTYNLYAVDDRLSAAAPVCMVSSVMQGGCVCENAPGLRFDTNNVEIGAMIAPKPLLLVNSTQDWTKHTPHVEYPAIRSIYGLYGAEENVEQTQIDAPHGYNKAMREAVYRWLGRTVNLPVPADYEEPPYETEPRENLLAFYDGLPKGALVDHAALFDEWKNGASRSVASFYPENESILEENRRVLGRGLRLSVGFEETGLSLKTEPSLWNKLQCEEGTLSCRLRSIEIPIRVFQPNSFNRTVTLLIHPLGMEGTYPPLISELLSNSQSIYAMDCFGTGQNVGPQDPELPRGSSNFFSTFNRSDLAERIGDIGRVLRFILDQDDSEIVNVVGYGKAGLWSLIAGACISPEKRLRFLLDLDGFDFSNAISYIRDFELPGIFHAGGLDNAAALLAPSEILLHNIGDSELRWVTAAYALFADAKLRIEDKRISTLGMTEFLIK